MGGKNGCRQEAAGPDQDAGLLAPRGPPGSYRFILESSLVLQEDVVSKDGRAFVLERRSVPQLQRSACLFALLGAGGSDGIAHAAPTCFI